MPYNYYDLGNLHRKRISMNDKDFTLKIVSYRVRSQTCFQQCSYHWKLVNQFSSFKFVFAADCITEGGRAVARHLSI